MIDQKTPYLKLPLPHEDNLLEDDVLRLKAAFTALDGYAQKADAALGASESRKVAKLVSKANSGRPAIAANATFTVPSYIVGSGKLQVLLEGCLCDAGEQYSEAGNAGAASTSIKWLVAVPVDYTISVFVFP